MARTPKPSGHLNRGPWTGAHCLRAFEHDSWAIHAQEGSHVQLKHPTRPGKITLVVAWTAITAGGDVWRGWMQQGGYSKRELLAIMNRG